VTRYDAKHDWCGPGKAPVPSVGPGKSAARRGYRSSTWPVENLALVLKNIGGVCLEMGAFQGALRYLQEAMGIFAAKSDETQIAQCNHAIERAKAKLKEE
jgi:hypothetical protein